MNNLYVIRNDDPIQLADEVGLNEDKHRLTGNDDLLSLNVDDLDGKERIEHRYNKRYKLNEDAFTLIRSISTEPLKIRGKSMGCIACAVFNARPAKLGKIDNISMGGLMFNYVDDKTHLSKALVLDILLADCGFYLADIPFKIISDFAIPEDIPGDPIEMRKVRLQFKNLKVDQKTRLKDFLLKHGTKIGSTCNSPTQD